MSQQNYQNNGTGNGAKAPNAKATPIHQTLFLKTPGNSNMKTKTIYVRKGPNNEPTRLQGSNGNSYEIKGVVNQPIRKAITIVNKNNSNNYQGTTSRIVTNQTYQAQSRGQPVYATLNTVRQEGGSGGGGGGQGNSQSIRFVLHKLPTATIWHWRGFPSYSLFASLILLEESYSLINSGQHQARSDWQYLNQAQVNPFVWRQREPIQLAMSSRNPSEFSSEGKWRVKLKRSKLN